MSMTSRSQSPSDPDRGLCANAREAWPRDFDDGLLYLRALAGQVVVHELTVFRPRRGDST